MYLHKHESVRESSGREHVVYCSGEERIMYLHKHESVRESSSRMAKFLVQIGRKWV